MESRSGNSEDSHVDKNVENGAAAADQKKEEVSKDDKERVIEEDKVEGGEENGVDHDEKKTDVVVVKNEEAKEGENGVDHDEKKTDVGVVKNEEAKGGENGVHDEKKTDVGVMKNEEAKEGDPKEINEADTSEAKEDVVKEMDEIDISEARKEEVIKDGELAKENESKAEAVAVAEEEKIIPPESVQKKVVQIGQNPKIIEDNGESNKNDEKKEADQQRDRVPSCNVNVNMMSFKEESNLFSDLKESEKKALVELRSKVEEAIKGNQLLKTKEIGTPKQNEGKEDVKDEDSKADSTTEEAEKEGEKNGQEGKNDAIAEAEDKKTQEEIECKKEDNSDKDIKLWGVPLLPRKSGKATDVVLLKFLRAREFKVVEAFEMLRNTLQWRIENKMDSILDEDLGNEFNSIAYINGTDRQGHPVCYNVFGVLDNDKMYNKAIGTEENRDKFTRWRMQLMEAGIKKLDFDDVSCLVQISDLKNTPGPSKKEVRFIMKQMINLLQDNYPEFVAKHIFVNVPLWYYGFSAILSPFLSQRTKSKFVYARPAKVIETLLKYIDVEELPICYGGLNRDKDSDFSAEDMAEEVVVKAISTETIEIPVPEEGSSVIWDLVVLGWDVSYKEEFVPKDEKSYTIIVQKERKLGVQDGSVRNSFTNKESGKIALIIDNASKSKKRAFYRYKIKDSSSSSSP